VVPVLAVGFAPFTHGWSLLLLLAYALQFAWIFRYGKQRGWAAGDAAIYAFFTMITKFPASQGMLAYYWRRFQGHAPTIMEHKES
jgi:hypothetical protein